MSLSDRLLALMVKKGINRSELAKGSGLPYTTVVAIFENGGDNTKLSTLRKLSAYFNVTLDELASDEEATGEAEPSEEDWTDEELKEIQEHKELLLLKRILKSQKE